MTELPPQGRAQQDYRQGEGLNANPYPKGSNERETYMLEMGRLLDLELKGLRDEMNAGPKPHERH